MTNPHPLLLETIKIKEGKIYNLVYHQKRCDKSRLDLYHTTKSLCLKSLINPPPTGYYRCRILYDTKIQSIEYIPYQEKEIKTLKIVNTPLKYDYKYANRTTLESLCKKHPEVDDILIESHGIIKDTSIANIAFYDGNSWVTPTNPLLEGTMRAKLLEEGFLQKKIIQKSDLHHYSHVALMNAMIGFKILKNITIHDEEGITYDY